MNIQSLTVQNVCWVDFCAALIQAAEPSLPHIAAVREAFDMHTTWPDLDPLVAAEAFVERETVVL